MNIHKMITEYNKTKTDGRKIEYIVIHYTANDGDTAKANCQYFSRKLPENKGASAHYFVDELAIWQCVDDKDIAWHCGTRGTYYCGCRNANSIGIEMCSRIDPATGKYYIKPEVIERTKMLVAYLMVKYNIKADHIVRHYDVTRKVCPEPMVRNEQDWLAFKGDLMWVDDVIFLKEKGRLYSSEDWVLKNYEQDPQLKFVFIKWANDVRTLTT